MQPAYNQNGLRIHPPRLCCFAVLWQVVCVDDCEEEGEEELIGAFEEFSI